MGTSLLDPSPAVPENNQDIISETVSEEYGIQNKNPSNSPSGSSSTPISSSSSSSSRLSKLSDGKLTPRSTPNFDHKFIEIDPAIQSVYSESQRDKSSPVSTPIVGSHNSSIFEEEPQTHEEILEDQYLLNQQRV